MTGHCCFSSGAADAAALGHEGSRFQASEAAAASAALLRHESLKSRSRTQVSSSCSRARSGGPGTDVLQHARQGKQDETAPAAVHRSLAGGRLRLPGAPCSKCARNMVHLAASSAKRRRAHVLLLSSAQDGSRARTKEGSALVGAVIQDRRGSIGCGPVFA